MPPRPLSAPPSLPLKLAMAAGLAAELLGVVAAIAFDGPVGYELAAALITTGGLLLGVGALSFALGPKG